MSGARRRSRAAIEERAARAAEGFRRQGIRAGDAVALLLRNDFAFFEATLAIGLLGAYAVPMNWQAGPAEWAYILQDCDARALVAHVDLLDAAQPFLAPTIFVLAVATPAELQSAFQVAADERRQADVAYWEEWSDQFDPIETPATTETGAVIYTSGSTGRPKGVRRPPVPRSPGSARALKVYGLDLPGPARVLINGPMYHSVPNAYARLAFRAGADIVLQPKFEPAEMLDLIEAYRITHMHIVPAMFTRLLQVAKDVHQHYDLSSLRYVVHGAAHCPPEMKAAMIDWLGPIVHEYYGSTETGLLTWLDSAEALRKQGSVGRALPGIELHILGPNGQPLGVHEIGDVYARSATLHQFAYIGQPERRADIARGDLVTGAETMRALGLLFASIAVFAMSFPAARADDKTACALITVQDASAVLGHGAKAMPAIAPMMCGFGAVSGPAQLMTIVETAGGVDPETMMKAMITSSNMDPTHPPAEMLSGVGDQAAFFYAANGDFSITAFAEGYSIQLMVQHGSGPTTAARKSAMIAVVRQMILRL